MIKLFRIDDRLIHGQVAFVWTKQLGIEGIVVANDDAANDDMKKLALKMATPANVKLAIRSVEGAINLLKNPKSEGMSILVIVNNPKDALRIIKEVGGITHLNIGNYGRMEDDKTKIKLSREIHANEEDIRNLREIINLGVEIEVQMVPSDPKKNMKNLLG